MPPAADLEDGVDPDDVDDEAPQPTAKLIEPSTLASPEALEAVWRDMRQAYYVSPVWRADFYTALAYHGFISVSQAVPGANGRSFPLLIPEIQRSYGVLDFPSLHIERNVRKRANRYELRFDSAFEEVMAALCAYHDNCWLLPEYRRLMADLRAAGPVRVGPRGALLEVHTVELCDAQTGELVAGELGYCVGSTYTSLTGFTQRERQSAGKIQLAGLACVLERAGAALWNLGHPPREATDVRPACMLYKREMGASVLRRDAFLQRWLAARDGPLLRFPASGADWPGGSLNVRSILDNRCAPADPACPAGADAGAGPEAMCTDNALPPPRLVEESAGVAHDAGAAQLGGTQLPAPQAAVGAAPQQQVAPAGS